MKPRYKVIEKIVKDGYFYVKLYPLYSLRDQQPTSVRVSVDEFNRIELNDKFHRLDLSI